MTDKTMLLENIDTAFVSLSSHLTEMSKATRGLQDELKVLHKMVRQGDKSNRIKKKRPQVLSLIHI